MPLIVKASFSRSLQKQGPHRARPSLGDGRIVANRSFVLDGLALVVAVALILRYVEPVWRPEPSAAAAARKTPFRQRVLTDEGFGGRSRGLRRLTHSGRKTLRLRNIRPWRPSYERWKLRSRCRRLGSGFAIWLPGRVAKRTKVAGPTIAVLATIAKSVAKRTFLPRRPFAEAILLPVLSILTVRKVRTIILSRPLTVKGLAFDIGLRSIRGGGRLRLKPALLLIARGPLRRGCKTIGEAAKIVVVLLIVVPFSGSARLAALR